MGVARAVALGIYLKGFLLGFRIPSGRLKDFRRGNSHICMKYMYTYIYKPIYKPLPQQKSLPLPTGILNPER